MININDYLQFQFFVYLCVQKIVKYMININD